MDITAVRMAIATAAGTVTLPGKAALTATWFLPDGISAPHFFPAEYDQTFDAAHNRAMDVLDITCRCLIDRADEQSAQQLMDLLFSGSGVASLKRAIEAARGAPGEPALGGAAYDLRVTRTTANRLYTHGDSQYVGGELTVHVIGPGEV